MILLSLFLACGLRAGERPGGWTGKFAPCERHNELLKPGHMDLGVRFSTSNGQLAVEFARALSYWTTLLDMSWHEEDSRRCAIQVVDGGRSLFRQGEAARAQFPGMPTFQGWIAFNPKILMEPSELFFAAVHEVGHLLGLPHNTNASSVMYFFYVGGPVVLDDADLAALAARHRVRPGITAHIFTPDSMRRR
jgi:hypothetical protein